MSVFVCLLLASFAASAAGEISDHASAGSRVRVACIGDSITYGYAMTNRTAECYPVQLARLLGEDCEVRNFGDPGAGVYTHSKAFGGKGPRSWALRGNLDKALAFRPDIVVSNLGINDVDEYAKEFLPDSKTGRTGLERGRFVREYVELLERFRAQNKDVRILIWTRLGPCMKMHRLKGNALPFVMSEDLEKVAKAAGAEGMDMYTPLLPLSETADFCADGIHPEGGACRVIAAETAKALGRKTGR